MRKAKRPEMLIMPNFSVSEQRVLLAAAMKI